MISSATQEGIFASIHKFIDKFTCGCKCDCRCCKHKMFCCQSYHTSSEEEEIAKLPSVNDIKNNNTNSIKSESSKLIQSSTFDNQIEKTDKPTNLNIEVKKGDDVSPINISINGTISNKITIQHSDSNLFSIQFDMSEPIYDINNINDERINRRFESDRPSRHIDKPSILALNYNENNNLSDDAVFAHHSGRRSSSGSIHANVAPNKSVPNLPIPSKSNKPGKSNESNELDKQNKTVMNADDSEYLEKRSKNIGKVFKETFPELRVDQTKAKVDSISSIVRNTQNKQQKQSNQLNQSNKQYKPKQPKQTNQSNEPNKLCKETNKLKQENKHKIATPIVEEIESSGTYPGSMNEEIDEDYADDESSGSHSF